MGLKSSGLSPALGQATPGLDQQQRNSNPFIGTLVEQLLARTPLHNKLDAIFFGILAMAVNLIAKKSCQT